MVIAIRRNFRPVNDRRALLFSAFPPQNVCANYFDADVPALPEDVQGRINYLHAI